MTKIWSLEYSGLTLTTKNDVDTISYSYSITHNGTFTPTKGDYIVAEGIASASPASTLICYEVADLIKIDTTTTCYLKKTSVPTNRVLEYHKYSSGSFSIVANIKIKSVIGYMYEAQ